MTKFKREIISAIQMGELLKKYRTEKEISIEKVSSLSNVSQELIEYFEEGKQPYKLSSSRLDKILHVLDLDECEFRFGNITESKPNNENKDCKNEFSNSEWKSDGLGRYQKRIILGFLEINVRIYEHYSSPTITKPYFYEYWLTFVDSEFSKDKFICYSNEAKNLTIEEICKFADEIIRDTLIELCFKLENKPDNSTMS